MKTKIKVTLLMLLFATFTILMLVPKPAPADTFIKGKSYQRTQGGFACKCYDPEDSCTCVLTDPSTT